MENRKCGVLSILKVVFLFGIISTFNLCPILVVSLRDEVETKITCTLTLSLFKNRWRKAELPWTLKKRMAGTSHSCQLTKTMWPSNHALFIPIEMWPPVLQQDWQLRKPKTWKKKIECCQFNQKQYCICIQPVAELGNLSRGPTNYNKILEKKFHQNKYLDPYINFKNSHFKS